MEFEQFTKRPLAVELLLQLAFGLALGFVLARSGFSDWSEVNAMFRFQQWRLLIAFATAVVLLVPMWLWVRRRAERLAPRPIHPGSLVGGLLFGAGWAVSGACPSIALVQVGQGKLMALFTVAGIAIGNLLYSFAHERWFRWESRTCADD